MTADDGAERLPDPQAVGSDVLDLLGTVDVPPRLWRIHWERDPRSPKRYPLGKYRFDAPHGEYPVTYANSDRAGAFAEVYGDLGRIKSEEAARQLSMMTCDRPLRLIDVDSPENQKRLGLDARISDAKQYRVTQAWSAYLHSRDGIDGIRYRSRHDSRTVNVCLFLDRCADDLVVHPEGTLQALRQTVLEIADRYDLSVYLPRPLPRRR